MYKSQKKLNAIDLFAGCGGMSLGFQNAGIKVLAAFDNWEPAIKVYRKNFQDHEIHKVDLSNIDISLLRKFKPDVIIGGPPCQDFSSAGKRDESLGRADLTKSFSLIVTAIAPKWFVMENVERATISKAFAKAYETFKKAGYGLSQIVLDASLCGVPQKRKRLFLIGELEGNDNAIEPFLKENLASKPMTIRDYLGDRLGVDHYYRHPRTYNRRGVFSIDEPSPTVRGVNRPIPATYCKHPGDTAPVSPILRPLTTKERSLIQTFPENFIFEGTKADLEQMIGNAVPVKLAEYVARCLFEYMTQKEYRVEPIQLSLLPVSPPPSLKKPQFCTS